MYCRGERYWAHAGGDPSAIAVAARKIHTISFIPIRKVPQLSGGGKFKAVSKTASGKEMPGQLADLSRAV